MPTFSSLVHALRARAEAHPSKIAFHFIRSDGKIENLTYLDLHNSAGSIGCKIASLASPGDRMLLCYPPGLEFVKAFFATLYAGAIAVPVALPRGRNDRTLRGIILSARPSAVLTVSAMLDRLDPHISDAEVVRIRRVATDGDITHASITPSVSVHPDTVCVLQYTSGSTTEPRGVMLSHDNVIRSAVDMAKTANLTSESIGVSWLPHFHDMGLFGGIVTPVVTGFSVALMAPTSFYVRPARWLEAISTFGATVSIAPNSAYELCSRQVSDADLATLSLGSWKIAGCGAEPILADTLEAFAQRFSQCGFESRAFYPCYGLAEATLMVSGGPAREGPEMFALSAAGLLDHRVEPAQSDFDAKRIVSSGFISKNSEVIVVDPISLVQGGSDLVGEIWVSGKTVGLGYWENAEETERRFGAFTKDGAGPYLRTGDLGFIHSGALYVTGRLKDLIVVHGRNFYPQDIEATAKHASSEVARVIAFGAAQNGTENPALVVELVKSPNSDKESICRLICDMCLEILDVELCHILLVPPGSLPMTSSGKPQRSRCRASILDGSLSVLFKWQPDPNRLNTDAGSERWFSSFVVPFMRSDEIARTELMRSYLGEVLQTVSRRSIDFTRDHSSVFDFGLSSIELMRVKVKIESELMISIDPELFWRESSLFSLCDYLVLKVIESPVLGDGEMLDRLDEEVREMSAAEVREALALIDLDDSIVIAM
jgi:acyl-CoA synthetase (AMP-forming)/AMP-acid ligase II/acyl carrier protein